MIIATKDALVVTAFLIHTITFLPNLFTKQLPITGSLAAKVTGCRSWFHQLPLLLFLPLLILLLSLVI
jgi:hypothetical protein